MFQIPLIFMISSSVLCVSMAWPNQQNLFLKGIAHWGLFMACFFGCSCSIVIPPVYFLPSISFIFHIYNFTIEILTGSTMMPLPPL